MTIIVIPGFTGYPEKIKGQSRGKKLKRDDVLLWIEKLLVKDSVKEDLKKINHQNYIGYSKENLREMITKIKAVVKMLYNTPIGRGSSVR